jgi:hypothetical protein
VLGLNGIVLLHERRFGRCFFLTLLCHISARKSGLLIFSFRPETQK